VRFSRQEMTFLFEIKLSEEEINEGYKHETKANYSRFKEHSLSLSLSLSHFLSLSRSLVIGTRLIAINSPQLIARVPDRKPLLGRPTLPPSPAFVGGDFLRSLAISEIRKKGFRSAEAFPCRGTSSPDHRSAFNQLPPRTSMNNGAGEEGG